MFLSCWPSLLTSNSQADISLYLLNTLDRTSGLHAHNKHRTESCHKAVNQAYSYSMMYRFVFLTTGAGAEAKSPSPSSSSSRVSGTVSIAGEAEYALSKALARRLRVSDLVRHTSYSTWGIIFTRLTHGKTECLRILAFLTVMKNTTLCAEKDCR
jgi:hypothetical protein